MIKKHEPSAATAVQRCFFSFGACFVVFFSFSFTRLQIDGGIMGFAGEITFRPIVSIKKTEMK